MAQSVDLTGLWPKQRARQNLRNSLSCPTAPLLRPRCTRRCTVAMLATYLPTRRNGDKACRAQAARHISRVRRGPRDVCSDDDTVIGPSSYSSSSVASFLQRGWQPPAIPPRLPRSQRTACRRKRPAFFPVPWCHPGIAWTRSCREVVV